ncbi:plastocyanin/azurin family copper-binding protein [Nitrososphaera sp.]|uniref:cupredoxin domain-containing protein n=1 Tax=Nitrososphaera sp. TaxID=1971748 RepID=UPI00307CDC0B
MTTPISNHAGGISFVAFVVAVAVSIGYYQFVYVPQVNAKPILPEEVLNPEKTAEVIIVPGSSLDSNGKFFEPKNLRTTIGIDNRVVWKNNDTVPHTVTTDTGYVDKINGKFESQARAEEPFVMPGKDYTFTFTAVGKYPYHCEPHPWMQGEVEVVENFA